MLNAHVAATRVTAQESTAPNVLGDLIERLLHRRIDPKCPHNLFGGEYAG
jgi:hypothetical protein